MITDEDSNWLSPIKKEILSRYQKIKATRARKKHYKLIAQLRSSIINKYYSEHNNHHLISVETSYFNDVFEFENILCDCQSQIDITKKMLEEQYGKEYICTAV